MKKIPFLLALLALALGARADDNAAKLALAREAVAAIQADKMLDGMAVQMKQMAAQYAHMDPATSPEARQKADALQAKILDLSMNEAKALMSKMDGIYASVYSEAELKAMVSFFKSPEGQSMLAKQPQVMAQVMPLISQMQQSLMPKIQQLVQESKAADAAPVAAPAPVAK